MDDVSEVDVVAGNTLWLGINQDAVGPTDAPIYQFQAYMIIEGVPTAGSWTGANGFYSPPAVAAAPGNSYLGVMGVQDAWLADALSNPPNLDVAGAGVTAEFEFLSGVFGPTDVVVNLYNSTFAVVDTITIHQIPEPITFGLLGLGGLFLRRRK